MARQFGTLGSGNHFAEISVDTEAFVWVLVHSGSRGPGNLLAQLHIDESAALCEREGIRVEERDLSYLPDGTPQFQSYIADMLWCQAYAFHQRKAMADRLLRALESEVRPFEARQEINCHHSYSEKTADGRWLSRKGAINAETGVPGIVPGSMGAATHIVTGKGNREAHNTAPHGAGRLRSRGAARRELDLAGFRAQMQGRVWQDRDAQKLIDEAPEAYKPMDVVMADSATLVDTVTVLRAIINYKGV
jgi:tRNA-splicing ligase RtcB